MQVIPAIDLRGGRCVRLLQGDYAQETVYSDDPAAMAEQWVDQGAQRLHVVDLDGARDGVRINADAVKRIVSVINVPIQLGGGIRDASTAVELVALGVDRVVFGTAALETPEEVASAVARCGAARVVVGVDARDGLVATRGWLATSQVKASDLMRRIAGLGVERFMYTDIARDGTLSHPNLKAVAAILEEIDQPLIAAGGIASLEDLEALDRLGIEAAVTGKAIYTGALNFAEAARRFSENR